jgi:RND family efflux transporter MFP subunit
MHPAYKSDKPGIAPDCGMQLEPVYADGGGSEAAPSPPVPGTVAIDADRQQVIGVRLGQAERLAPNQTMRVLGRVVVDETRIYRVFAAVDGWVREISPNATGNIVEKDELLATYFSRELLTPQQAYLYALNTRDQAIKRGESNPDQTRVIDLQVRNAEEGLLTLGMTEHQIREVARNRAAASIMQVRAPATGIILVRNVSRGLRIDRTAELYRMADLSHVWVLADLYEREAQLVPLGAPARVHYQGRAFPGEISKALPQFDPTTRTLKVRLELDNPDYSLRPDMFVDVEFPVRLPAAVTVPVDAVIDSGLRKTVYVERGAGLFEPRRVETGWRFGDRVAIVKGLEAGDRIVVAGTFLIDSESRMKLAAAQAKPEQKKAAGVQKDPVCGMEVDASKAAKSEYRGKTYYFCSEHCKKEFDKNPARYLEKKATGAGTA